MLALVNLFVGLFASIVITGFEAKPIVGEYCTMEWYINGELRFDFTDCDNTGEYAKPNVLDDVISSVEKCSYYNGYIASSSIGGYTDDNGVDHIIGWYTTPNMHHTIECVYYHKYMQYNILYGVIEAWDSFDVFTISRPMSTVEWGIVGGTIMALPTEK